MLATAMKTLEIEDGAIFDLIENDADRIDLAELTEDASFPRIVNIQVSDAPDGITHTGEDNLYLARWQVDNYAQDFDTAERTARVIWEKLVPIWRRPVGSLTITSCRRVSQRFFKETALDKWRFIQEFEFRYSYHNEPGN